MVYRIEIYDYRNKIEEINMKDNNQQYMIYDKRFMEMVNYLIKDDRIMRSDRNYVYNVFEFGNSMDKKKAYADKFCELCNDIGIATTKKLLPYSAREQLINFYTNQ